MVKQSEPEEFEQEIRPVKLALIVVGVFIASSIILVGLLIAGPGGPLAREALNELLSIDSERAVWYITRAAGIVAYLLLWLSTLWGLAISNKFLDPVLQRVFSFDFHELLSLLAIGFTVLHMAILLVGSYMPFTLAQILVPFTAPYRPAWIGIGVIGFYLVVLVSITFYIRRHIGQRTFRVIHYLSYVAYLGSTLHSIFSGSDSALPAASLMYAGTFLGVIFMTAYRVVIGLLNRRAAIGHNAARHPAR